MPAGLGSSFGRYAVVLAHTLGYQDTKQVVSKRVSCRRKAILYSLHRVQRFLSNLASCVAASAPSASAHKQTQHAVLLALGRKPAS
jgi:hypothetical protein